MPIKRTSMPFLQHSTGHDLLAIQGLYRLYEELPWFPRGKDLSRDSMGEP